MPSGPGAGSSEMRPGTPSPGPVRTALGGAVTEHWSDSPPGQSWIYEAHLRPCLVSDADLAGAPFTEDSPSHGDLGLSLHSSWGPPSSASLAPRGTRITASASGFPVLLAGVFDARTF